MKKTLYFTEEFSKTRVTNFSYDLVAIYYFIFFKIYVSRILVARQVSSAYSIILLLLSGLRIYASDFILDFEKIALIF